MSGLEVLWNKYEEPVQRYFQHAIKSTAILASSVKLKQKARMKLNPNKPHIVLDCNQVLEPAKGFCWSGRFKIWSLPAVVQDQLKNNQGSICVRVLGVPIIYRSDSNITRSSRGRLAAEVIWCPSALLLNPSTIFETLDENTIQITQIIDDEENSLTLELSEDGSVRCVKMLRFGNEGRQDWGLTPYGFSVEEEKTFGNYTIPTKFRGGWWYGTPQFVHENASEYEVTGAEYHF
ncbi:MAG TPA: hypothetical protein PKC21_03115 [Oligoflexia bacterium]|nr:hypothetical protein [Oligoflexia bacterium]HMR24324.1 hypothetical protein [Oligoflexia bacterium]